MQDSDLGQKIPENSCMFTNERASFGNDCMVENRKEKKAQKRESSETSCGLAVKFPRRLKLVGIGRHAFLWFTSELFCPKGIKHKSTFATACLHITEQHRRRFGYVCQILQLYLGPNVDAREPFRTDTVNLVSTCCHSTRR